MDDAEPQPVRRVVSEATAAMMVETLKGVVSTHGTARRAAIEGIDVAGKTGTSQKYDIKSRFYSRRKYMASFIGFYPADDPQICMGIFIDEPPYAKRYGGVCAAPLFSRIGSEIMFYLKK